ncbi:MAG: Nif3-like dinuclear metal center hexameric protein [Bacteroidales bacterium]|nr:MAG: Nif3-like dinuclear metal center hexameric protein [Bacteroidales bacterium]
MIISDVTALLEQLAPLSYQESYDNSGLLVGDPSIPLKGILATLDVTPEVVEEAHQKGLNIIVSHHPLIFNGLKKIVGKTYVEKAVVLAIKYDIAIYAAHTNLDNIKGGVNSKIGELLGLNNLNFLSPIEGELVKVIAFVPSNMAEKVRQAMFDAGAGSIGNYDCCSYNIEGKGTFRASEGTNPYVGNIGELHFEPETRIEVIVQKARLSKVIREMILAHPYEEVAYDIYPLLNTNNGAGAGMVGELESPISELDFLKIVKKVFNLQSIRHTSLLGKEIKKIAFCGGSGAFLIKQAIAVGADIFITGDVKYHQFFDAENRIIIADIGHFESEQFTVDIFYEYLLKNFPKFAVLKSEIKTNPINYI